MVPAFVTPDFPDLTALLVLALSSATTMELASITSASAILDLKVTTAHC